MKLRPDHSYMRLIHRRQDERVSKTPYFMRILTDVSLNVYFMRNGFLIDV